MPVRRFGRRRILRARRRTLAQFQCINIAGSLVVTASTGVSTSKTFTYAQLFGSRFTSSALPILIRKVVIEVSPSIIAGVSGAATLFAELVGQPFTSGAGAATEGACPSRLTTVSSAGKAFLVLKPRLSGNRNWIDPTSTNTMISMSAISAAGVSLQYAIRVFYTVSNESGYVIV